ncbi:Transmembrane protein C9orf5 [Echinococcus granulosus]|uniref:Transmembrane protein C9orf5 n=1 Tax=Echinococcus granulosus TaxID=6210 RepID=W6UQ99_ECHGR|nr:Transmembrane protein C9orf5 [Echinococcus granulosus]EUB63413.1 Transmembrane protein C9orf5 [Echinococcus granulosus]
MSQGRGQMTGVGCFQLPLDSLSSLLPYTDRKALRYAFYNTVAVVCLVSIMVLCIAICLVLKAFLRPICWALIVGTCLFPCKLMLTIYLRKYLQQQKERGCLFVLTVALTPVKFFQSTATTFLDTLWSKVSAALSKVNRTGQSTTAGTLLRRLSLLPESKSGDACSQSFSSPQILQMAGGKGHVFPATSGVSDTSNALVRACFTGLGLVHFAVAFWTRTWLFRLVLVFTSIGLLAYAVASLQLVPGALWLLRRIWISLKVALCSSDSFVMVENSECSPLLIPASLKASLRWARKIERHIYDVVDNYLDYLVSLVIVSLMVLISLLFTVFLVIQVGGLSI